MDDDPLEGSVGEVAQAPLLGRPQRQVLLQERAAEAECQDTRHCRDRGRQPARFGVDGTGASGSGTRMTADMAVKCSTSTASASIVATASR